MDGTIASIALYVGLSSITITYVSMVWDDNRVYRPLCRAVFHNRNDFFTSPMPNVSIALYVGLSSITLYE